jgi:murein DD-endopeptidase MepM/ murein hydrolase activator NlpD
MDRIRESRPRKGRAHGTARWGMAILLAITLGAVGPAGAQIRITPTAKPTATQLKLTAGIGSPIRHLDRIDKRAAATVNPTELSFDPIEAMINAPQNVNISMEPKEGDYLVYELTPGFDFYEAPLAQLSVLAYIQNKNMQQVDLDKVTIEYKRNGQPVTKNIYLPSDKLIVEPNYTRSWQNGRDYHKSGDVVFLESPFPAEATFRFYFKGYTVPIVLKKKLKAYTTALDLPFAKKDLDTDEYWTGYSMHGGGDQVFAYDLGVGGYSDGWNSRKEGKTGENNSDFRIWGKPIYAMADGYVLEALNVCPNNGAPIPNGLSDADFDTAMTDQKNKYWGAYEDQGGGGGNHLVIRHGNLVALYAHMQKGTIGAKFLTKGAPVKKGELLGLAGNSGNSSGPHLHIHVKTYKDDDTPGGKFFRPLIFQDGFVIGQGDYASPKSNVAWSSLDKEGIPGLQGKSCFIWPGDDHPYCASPGNYGEVSRHGIAAASFQEEFDKIWTCGYYPVWIDGYDVGGNTYFNLICRPSKGVQWVARHAMSGASYQTEYNKWDQAGYRLLTIDSYKKGNQVAYAAVWVKDGAPEGLAYHGATLAWHEQNFKANADKGYVPVNVSCVSVGSETYVTALWEKKSVGGFYSRPAMTLQQYKDYFKDYSDTQKLKLVYLNAYTKGGVPMLSGIWYKNAPNYASWWAKHHLTPDAYQTEYKSQLDNGYLTRCVTGYADAGGARFEGIWSK